MKNKPGFLLGLDAKRAFHNSSGLGNYSRTLISALHEHFPEIELNLFTPQPGQLFKEAKSFSKIITPKNIWTMSPSLWRKFLLANESAKLGIQIFHGLSNEIPLGLQRKNIRSVATIHDVIFLKHPEFYTATNRKIYLAKTKHAIENADRIIAISQQTKNDLIQLLDASENKIRVVYQSIRNNIAIENPSEIFVDLKEKYSISEKFILAVGTIEERKNYLIILKAMLQIQSDVQLIIAGKKKSYSVLLEQYIIDHQLGGRIKIIEGLNDSGIQSLYNHASVFVYPSLYEGFGLPVAEAMQAGAATIASDNSCLQETGGNAALYANPNDANEWAEKINFILTNPEKKLQMVEAGKKQAATFSSFQFANETVKVYEELL